MQLIVYIVLILAGLGFLAGIISAFNYSKNGTPDKMPPFLRQVVTVIGGVLATNFGAVIGIKIKEAGIHTLFRLVNSEGFDLQILAAYLYFIGLLFGLLAWALLKFEEDPNKVVVILPQLAQTLLGVAAGVLAVQLGVSS